MEVHWAYCADHSSMYTVIGSLHYTSETIINYVNYTLGKKKKKKLMAIPHSHSSGF